MIVRGSAKSRRDRSRQLVCALIRVASLKLCLVIHLYASHLHPSQHHHPILVTRPGSTLSQLWAVRSVSGRRVQLSDVVGFFAGQ
jgi:hypothetical protein